jgi:hypothetical protein
MVNQHNIPIGIEQLLGPLSARQTIRLCACHSRRARRRAIAAQRLDLLHS